MVTYTRLDYLSLTGEGYIPSIYKKYGQIISLMGCRAALSPWYVRGGMHPADENDYPVFEGRCNLGAISLHLCMILAKSREEGRDFYEAYLGGPLSLVTIENKNATTDKELIMFRDSYGSSLAPLFIEGYKKITLIDIRYMHPNMIEQFVEFNNQDVLFIYSTSVLNNSETLK